MIKFKPTRDYMLVERAITTKNIIMPEKQEPNETEIFRVLDVGPGEKSVKVGDLVCILGYITTYTYKGTKGIIARVKDVTAKIEETDTYLGG